MMSSEEDEPYAVLGLSPGASPRDVKSRFRRLAKRFHPDLNAGDAWHQEQFRRIHAAYEAIESAHKRAASYRLPEEPANDTVDAADSNPNPSPAAWVHVGEATAAGTPFFNSTGSPVSSAPSARRRGFGRRAGQLAKARLITGGLAVAALFLVVIAIAGPRSNDAVLASGIAQGSASLAAPDIMPPVALLQNTDAEAEHGDVATVYPVSGGFAKSPLLEQGMGYGSTVPQSTPTVAVPDTKFSVDEKYTHIDPTYTAIDTRYTTVNVDALGASPEEMGVDSKYTSIDSKITQP